MTTSHCWWWDAYASVTKSGSYSGSVELGGFLLATELPSSVAEVGDVNELLP